jgi:peptide/nickel transport system permease protein
VTVELETSAALQPGLGLERLVGQRGPRLDRLAHFVRGDTTALVGTAIVGLVVLLMILSPWLVRYDPVTANAIDILLPPSANHWFGTDNLGMDIFSRVIYAPRVDLVIALASAVLAVAIGLPVGVISGFYRGLAAEAISRVADVIQTFPVFVLAMATVAMTGQNIWNVVFVIALLNAPIYLRLMRGQTHSLRERLFIEAARCAGNRDWQIIYRHLVPNAIGPAVAQFSINIGWAMLLTAGLSFVGAGVRVPTAEWGLMIASGAQNMITGQWWIAFFPGVALGLTVLGFALLGDAFERYFTQAR